MKKALVFLLLLSQTALGEINFGEVPKNFDLDCGKLKIQVRQTTGQVFAKYLNYELSGPYTLLKQGSRYEFTLSAGKTSFRQFELMMDPIDESLRGNFELKAFDREYEIEQCALKIFKIKK